MLYAAKNYWAKDLIFLVTSCGEVGMQAWVDQYMGLTKSMFVCVCSEVNT